MKIANFLGQTTIDYPGKLACQIFTKGCNFRCPACYSKNIVEGNSEVPVEEVFSYIKEINSEKKWLDGIVICGGEPTIHKDLENFLGNFKKEFPDLAVKLDTNGNNPDVLKNILEKKLADYVAMDVKSCAKLYVKVIGHDNSYIDYSITRIEESMKLLSNSSVDYEFRTTISPIIINDDEKRFMDRGEFEEMAKWIVNITGKNNHRYFLQPFIAMNKAQMIDERFSSENLVPEMKETPDGVMKEAYETIKLVLPNVRIR